MCIYTCCACYSSKRRKTVLFRRISFPKKNLSQGTIFQNKEIKKKRIYSFWINPFLNLFNNNSVVRSVQNTVGIQIRSWSDQLKFGRALHIKDTLQ